MSVISIIGAGWLGLPLAKHLATQGHTVYASRTTAEHLAAFDSEQVRGFVCDLNQPAQLAEELKEQQSEIVIGCFPPGFRQPGASHYVANWQQLVSAAQQAGVQRLVMISSTTVYPSQDGDMHETMASLHLSQHHSGYGDKAVDMLTAEQAVIDSGIGYAIVRCSGLMGPDRNPARFAQYMKQVSRLAPANMLHLIDAIGAASFVAQRQDNLVVNATTPNTVSKAEFYQHALQLVDQADALPAVVDTPDKRIMPDALIQLGYQYHFQHTLDALDHLEQTL
ncbi:NAD(P)H-binding protein [Vibrio sp.]|uniref:NAD(P)H-binding protein n=1 Tax=Vibrio sp. TaxID=678 RepID=UPI003D14CB23